MSDQETILTEDQKVRLIDFWNAKIQHEPPSLKEMCELVFGEGVDPRSKNGRAVREFLASRSLRATTVADSRKPEEVVLTEVQKEFIKNNFNSLSSIELARELFNNDKLNTFHKETIAIKKYVEEISGDNLNKIQAYEKAAANDDNTEYKPPNTLERACYRVNKYILDAITPGEY